MPSSVVDSATSTVPVHADKGDAANSLFGATMEHAAGTHEAQLHDHSMPEPVPKPTESTAPA